MENTDILTDKRGDLLSPRQIFTYPLKDLNNYTIEKAKREIFSCASELGYTNYDQFTISRFMETDGTEKHALNATFHQ